MRPVYVAAAIAAAGALGLLVAGSERETAPALAVGVDRRSERIPSDEPLAPVAGEVASTAEPEAAPERVVAARPVRAAAFPESPIAPVDDAVAVVQAEVPPATPGHEDGIAVADLPPPPTPGAEEGIARSIAEPPLTPGAGETEGAAVRMALAPAPEPQVWARDVQR